MFSQIGCGGEGGKLLIGGKRACQNRTELHIDDRINGPAAHDHPIKVRDFDVKRVLFFLYDVRLKTSYLTETAYNKTIVLSALYNLTPERRVGAYAGLYVRARVCRYK